VSQRTRWGPRERVSRPTSWQGGGTIRVVIQDIHGLPKTSDIREVQGSQESVARNHGNEEISPPPSKKSCMDRAKNGIARTAAQIRTGHWRSAVYLKGIKRHREDRCWFCRDQHRMTRSHVLLHCHNDKIRAAREKAWEGKGPSGVTYWPTLGGRKTPPMDRWIVWEARAPRAPD
jgi:hypothetical protein